MTPAKLLVLGIDAANPGLLMRWAEDGTLPNIGSLIGRGLVGSTQSEVGFFIGSTWPSFYTGVTPARHGFHYLVQLEPGTYQLHRPAAGEFVRCAPFWTHLSRAGRRVAILDVPLSRIDPSLNGVQVVEWGGHDAVFGFQTWPSSIAQTITARFGPHPLGASCDAVRRSPDEYTAFTNALIRGVHTRAKLTRHFLEQGGWDLLVQVFTESHCVGHQCWHLHDTTHPAHDAAIVAATGDPLRSVYAAIDAAIGEVLEPAGDALVVLLAAHGMAHFYGAHFLLDEILFRLGVSRRSAGAGLGPSAAAAAVARRVWRGVPERIRDRLAPLRNRLFARAGRGRVPSLAVDPATSSCFSVNNGLAVGAIRLNLVGREPQGILEPGRAADEFCAQLADDLLGIIDDRTGGPLVRRVLRTSDVYVGEQLDRLPDLLVEWSDDARTGSTLVGNGAGAVVRARLPGIGPIEGVNQYGRTGEHRPGGLFIAAGPGVQPGRLGRVASILDFAPTFAGLLGVTLPRTDGRPLAELGAPA